MDLPQPRAQTRSLCPDYPLRSKSEWFQWCRLAPPSGLVSINLFYWSLLLLFKSDPTGLSVCPAAFSIKAEWEDSRAHTHTDRHKGGRANTVSALSLSSYCVSFFGSFMQNLSFLPVGVFKKTIPNHFFFEVVCSSVRLCERVRASLIVSRGLAELCGFLLWVRARNCEKKKTRRRSSTRRNPLIKFVLSCSVLGIFRWNIHRLLYS